MTYYGQWEANHSKYRHLGHLHTCAQIDYWNRQTRQTDGEIFVCGHGFADFWCVANCDLSILEEGYILITQMCALVTLEMYHDWPMPRGQVAFQQWTQGRSWSISIVRARPRDSIDGDRQINRTTGLFLLCVYCHVVCNPETEKDRKVKHDQIRLEGIAFLIYRGILSLRLVD